MEFGEEISNLIAGEETNKAYNLVRGGQLVLTIKNTYVIEETVTGNIERFQKIRNEEIKSIVVEKEENLLKSINLPFTNSILEDATHSEEPLSEEILKEAGIEDGVSLEMLSRLVNRERAATAFTTHLDNQSPTVYVEKPPEAFVRDFLQSEAYRQNYKIVDTGGL